MAAVPHDRRLREDASGLSVVAFPRPPSSCLVLAGELDLSTTARLTEVLERSERECPGSIVVDLHAVPFADCAGARPLLHAAHRLAARGVRLDICGAPPRVALVLAHLGVPTRPPEPGTGGITPRAGDPPGPRAEG